MWKKRGLNEDVADMQNSADKRGALDAKTLQNFAYFILALQSCVRLQGWDILDTRSRTGPLGDLIMQWTAPAFEEVCLNCEINSYVSAKL